MKLEEEKSNEMTKRSSSSSVELLTHKVRYLEKELEISNKRLSKYQEAVHAFLFIRIYFIRILKMKWDKKLRIS